MYVQRRTYRPLEHWIRLLRAIQLASSQTVDIWHSCAERYAALLSCWLGAQTEIALEQGRASQRLGPINVLIIRRSAFVWPISDHWQRE